MAASNTPPTTIDSVREWANRQLVSIETVMDADGLAIISPITFGLEHHVKVAVESRTGRRKALFVVLDTPGGIVEVVERIVRVLRHHYEEVRFVVPDRAMSAGTVLVMSGDDILMDYHSCLGPIDPQVEREDRLVPALSYLSQYEFLIARSLEQELSTAEIILLQKLDLAELHQFEMARDLSIELLRQWLARYKFKDWITTETRGLPVTPTMKHERAEWIAGQLSEHQRWLSHGRGLDMKTLRDELKLKIHDYGQDPGLRQAVWDYFWFLKDHMARNGVLSLVHSLTYF